MGHLIIRRGRPEFLHGLFDREGAGSLAWREFLETQEMLSYHRLRREKYKGVLDEPSHVVTRLVLGPLERIRAQVKQHREAQLNERLLPDIEAFGLLLQEDRLPLFVAKTGQIAVIGPVEKLAALVGALAGEQLALVVAVEVNVEVLAAAS